MSCPDCSNAQSEIAALQREVAVLSKKIFKLEKRIELLQKRLTAIRQICAYIIKEADKKLSGHNPRGIWAFAKGAKKTAESVYPYCQ